ncbi:MAG: hypothetical protein CSA95_00420 [Bacteroidetes bacterium]|nr:MAG: hypothetical protein CSA95_00420 [Bacteroidota bacterium]
MGHLPSLIATKVWHQKPHQITPISQETDTKKRKEPPFLCLNPQREYYLCHLDKAFLPQKSPIVQRP